MQRERERELYCILINQDIESTLLLSRYIERALLLSRYIERVLLGKGKERKGIYVCMHAYIHPDILG